MASDTCLRPMMPVCSLACGSGRSFRIWAAAKAGADGPPADLRFLEQPRAELVATSSTAGVTSFLN